MTFIAQVFGLYCIILGAIIILRQKTVMRALADLANQRAALLLFGCLELLGGLALAVAFVDAGGNKGTALFVLGCLMVIESVFYVAASASLIKKVIRWFNHPWWYWTGGLLSIALGVFLLI